MDSQTIFTQLREALVNLYPREEESRVVTHDARLNAGNITFSSRAQSNWYNILAEAIRDNKVDALLNVVLGSYSNNTKFLAAYGLYRHFIDQGGQLEPPPASPGEQGGPVSINTGGGAYIAGGVNLSGGDFVGRDKITVGNITGSQGIAIGSNANATVTGSNITSGARIDPSELRAALEQFYDALGGAELPRDKSRTVQTAAGNALDAVKDDQVNGETVTTNIQKIGETFKQANVAVSEGTTLWESIKKLAPLIGPLVGGARIVAGWFGIPV